MLKKYNHKQLNQTINSQATLPKASARLKRASSMQEKGVE
jgi:hypothetical protein